MRSHLEAVYRQTGKIPARLAEIPPMPEQLAYVWAWFCELERARTGNGFGLNPLSYTEIKAWADLSGSNVEPWEVAVLKRFDAVRIRVANEK